ncbi:MAG: recombinase family protein [Clostridium sp.]|nr:recombinase family protein [Clostridium sp.]
MQITADFLSYHISNIFRCAITTVSNIYNTCRCGSIYYDSTVYKAKLKKYGVRVLSARENISDDASGILMESVLEGMAEYYSAELAQKVKRGMDLNAKRCLSTGGNVALGYKVDKDKHFQIDTNYSHLVEYIFESYASGSTVTEIVNYLNDKGYKTAKGAKFHRSTVTQILQNKRYIGIYTYKGTETPDGIPRIISDELFDKSAERMSKNRKALAHSKAHSATMICNFEGFIS